MNCPEVRSALLAHLEGDPALAPEESRALAEHLAGCAECRSECEALREQLALLRGAGSWAAEAGAKAAARLPGNSPAAGPRRSSRTILVAAAAAALLLAVGGWVLLRRGNADSAGRLVGTVESGVVLHGGSPVEALHGNESYQVPPGRGALARLCDGTPLWIGGASSFSFEVGAGSHPRLELHSGSLVCGAVTPLEVRWKKMGAFACGWFAMGAPGEAAPIEPGARVANIWSDWLFPPAVAAESPEPAPVRADRGPAVFLLLSGWTELRVGEEELSLVGRRLVFGGDGRPVLVGPPEGLLSSATAERRGLLEGLRSPRYRSMKAEFSSRQSSYLARLAAPGTNEQERQDLAWRIALLGELCAAQDARLGSLASLEGPRERRAALLGLRIARLRALGQEIAAAEHHLTAWPQAE